jgi:hypothetical protein
VLDQLLGDIGHVHRFTCEDVDGLLEEADECIFLFGIEAGPNPSGLGWITRDEVDLLYFL